MFSFSDSSKGDMEPVTLPEATRHKPSCELFAAKPVSSGNSSVNSQGLFSSLLKAEPQTDVVFGKPPAPFQFPKVAGGLTTEVTPFQVKNISTGLSVPPPAMVITLPSNQPEASTNSSQLPLKSITMISSDPSVSPYTSSAMFPLPKENVRSLFQPPKATLPKVEKNFSFAETYKKETIDKSALMESQPEQQGAGIFRKTPAFSFSSAAANVLPDNKTFDCGISVSITPGSSPKNTTRVSVVQDSKQRSSKAGISEPRIVHEESPATSSRSSQAVKDGADLLETKAKHKREFSSSKTRKKMRDDESKGDIKNSRLLSPEEINQITTVVCKGIHPDLNHRSVLFQHFSKFGEIKKISCGTRNDHATVTYFNHEAALKAKQSGGVISSGYKPAEIFWAQKTSKLGDGKKSLLEAEVNQELQSMMEIVEHDILDRPRSASPTPKSTKKKSTTSKKRNDTPKSDSKDRKRSGKTVKPSRPKPSKIGDSSGERHLVGKSKKHDSADDAQAKESLKELLKMEALTEEDKYLVLDARDKLMRLSLQKQSDISKAKAIVGTCPDICSEKERYSRFEKKCLSVYEQKKTFDPKVPVKCMDHRIIVKEYSRSSADKEEPLPHEIRPTHVLTLTMDYLMCNVANRVRATDSAVSVGEWYDFIWNRTRAVRKDIAQQDLCNIDCVKLVEKCVRFHIHCAAALCDEDMAIFDPKINDENLTKSLQTLKHMYHDLGVNGVKCSNEAEFRAYDILLSLNEGDTLRQAQNFSSEIRDSPEVRFAVSAAFAMNSNNYVRFFKLVEEASYLNACIMHRYFTPVRVRALRVMLKAYCLPNHTELYPLEELVSILKFESTTEAAQFCQWLGFQTEGNYVQLDRMSFTTSSSSAFVTRSINFIEGKRTISVGEVMNKGSLPVNPLLFYEPHNSFDSSGFLKQESYDASDQRQKAHQPSKIVKTIHRDKPVSAEQVHVVPVAEPAKKKLEITFFASPQLEVPAGASPKLETPVGASPKLETSVGASPRLEIPVRASSKLEIPVCASPKLEIPVCASPKLGIPVCASPKLEIPVGASPKFEIPIGASSKHEIFISASPKQESSTNYSLAANTSKFQNSSTNIFAKQELFKVSSRKDPQIITPLSTAGEKAGSSHDKEQIAQASSSSSIIPKEIHPVTDHIAEVMPCASSICEKFLSEVIDNCIREIVANEVTSFKREAICTQIRDSVINDVVGELCYEISHDVISEEKQVEINALQVQERKKKCASSLAEEIIIETVQEDVSHLVVHECTEAKKKALNAVCNSVMSSIFNSCVGDLISSTAKEIFDEEMENWKDLVQMAKRKTQLQQARKALLRWQRAYTKRRKLEICRDTFPCSPQVPLRMKSAIADFGNVLSRIKKEKELAKLLDAGVLLSNIKQELSWLPLDLSTLFEKHFPKSKDISSTNPKILCWKLLLLVPESCNGHEDAEWISFIHWFCAKFCRKKYENVFQDGMILCDLFSKYCLGYHVDICVRAILLGSKNFLQNLEIMKKKKLLEGTSATFLIMPYHKMDNLVQKEILNQVQQILSVKYPVPPLPLYCFLVGSEVPKIPSRVTEFLNTLKESSFLCDYKISVIQDTTQYWKSSEMLLEATAWLLKQYNGSPLLKSWYLKVFVEDCFLKIFSIIFDDLPDVSSPTEEQLATALHKHMPPCSILHSNVIEAEDYALKLIPGYSEFLLHAINTNPSTMINFYNSALDDYTEAVCSSSLSDISWPPPEMITCKQASGIETNWNELENLNKIRAIMDTLHLPEFQGISGKLEDMWAYAEAVANLGKCNTSNFFSSIKSLLLLNEQSVANRRFIPWSDILYDCAHYLISCQSFMDEASKKKFKVACIVEDLNVLDLKSKWKCISAENEMMINGSAILVRKRKHSSSEMCESSESQDSYLNDVSEHVPAKYARNDVQQKGLAFGLSSVEDRTQLEYSAHQQHIDLTLSNFTRSDAEEDPLRFMEALDEEKCQSESYLSFLEATAAEGQFVHEEMLASTFLDEDSDVEVVAGSPQPCSGNSDCFSKRLFPELCLTPTNPHKSFEALKENLSVQQKANESFERRLSQFM